MNELRCKVLVIGGGPGGYIAAIRAGQLGLDVILAEANRPGGACLNVGCIPSKALIHVADEFHKISHNATLSAIGVHAERPRIEFAESVAWKDGIVSRLTGGVSSLLKKAKVRTLDGRAIVVDGKTAQLATRDGDYQISCEHMVIATGSTPAPLASLPFGGDVLSSTEALALSELPRSLAVVGAGYIGLELGMAFAKLGVSTTIVEAQDRILPLYDAELTAPVSRRLKDLGVTVHLGARALGRADGRLRIADAQSGERDLEAAKILVAVGRRPCTQGFGLERLELAMSGPYLRIDERCATSMRNCWAIGDVTGEPMLAHRAMAQGEMVAEILAGHRRAWDRVAIPAVTFTDPEIVSVGLSPDDARARYGEVRVGVFPFRANGRAMTRQAEVGFVRVVARADDHVVLGVQAVGAEISELSASFALAIEMGARLEDVAGTIHAHPTQSEAFAESALAATGAALHI